jgi:hypothetical protein
MSMLYPTEYEHTQIFYINYRLDMYIKTFCKFPRGSIVLSTVVYMSWKRFPIAPQYFLMDVIAEIPMELNRLPITTYDYITSLIQLISI